MPHCYKVFVGPRCSASEQKTVNKAKALHSDNLEWTDCTNLLANCDSNSVNGCSSGHFPVMDLAKEIVADMVTDRMENPEPEK